MVETIKTLWDDFKNNINFLKASFLFAFFSHFVILADYLFNHDSLVLLYSDLSWTLAQGKWFAKPISILKGPLAVHYTSAIIGIIFLSLSATLILIVLEIRNKYLSYLCVMLFVSFPAVTVILFYNGLDYFSITIFLSVLSAYFIKKEGLINVVTAIALCTISLGTYQGGIGFAAVLCVIMCIKKCMDDKEQLKEIVHEGMRYIIYLASSAICYYVILKIVLKIKDVQLSSYKGMDNVLTVIYPKTFIVSLYNTFIKSVQFIWNNNLGPENGIIIVAYRTFAILLLFSLLIYCINCIIRRKEIVKQILWLFLFLVALPISANFPNFLAQGSSFYYITCYSLVMIFIAAIVFIDEIMISNKVYYFSALSVGIIIIYAWFISNNMLYEKGRFVAQQINSKSIEIVTRVHEIDGLKSDTPIVFVGDAPYLFLETKEWSAAYEYSNYSVMGVGNASEVAYNPGILISYIQNVLGYNDNYQTYDTCESVLEDEEHFRNIVDSMTVYPYKGSIQMCDGIVFVKMSDDY